MILTVTLNPAVDLTYQLDELAVDSVNRVEHVVKSAGGKGINVSRIIHQLGASVHATGFLGSYPGHFIKDALKRDGISHDFLEVKGATRHCVTVIHGENQTELLEQGPVITSGESEHYLKPFTEQAHDKEVIVLSGSLPQGVPTDYYRYLIAIAEYYNIPVILDTSGEALADVLRGKEKPYMVKPNEAELAELLGQKTLTEADMITALKSSIFSDIPLVIVTRGEDGALIRYHDTFYYAEVPSINIVNAVGSGDAVVAGIATGLTRDLEGEALITYGLALGVLNALEDKIGKIDTAQLEWARDQITITELQTNESS